MLISRRPNKAPSQIVEGNRGRPPKYNPIPSDIHQIRPMMYEEALHHIRYFKGGLNYIHYSEVINDFIALAVAKPKMLDFLELSSSTTDAIFAVIHLENDESQIYVGLWGSRIKNTTGYLNPNAHRPQSIPLNAQKSMASTTQTMREVVSIQTEESDAQTNDVHKLTAGYDPRLNFYDDHMQDAYNSGECLWDEDTTPPQWVDRNSKDGAPATIPAESPYAYLNEWAVGSAKHVNPDGTQNHAMLLETGSVEEVYPIEEDDEDDPEGDKALYQMMLDSGKPISNFGANGARLQAQFPHMKSSK